MWIAGNTTTTGTLETTPAAGPEAQLMLLQLFTQLKLQNDTLKDDNASSDGEEVLKTLARNATVLEEDTEGNLTRSKRVYIWPEDYDMNTDRKYLWDTENCWAHVEELDFTIKKKEKQIMELQEKLNNMHFNNANAETFKWDSNQHLLIKAAKTGNIADITNILDSGGIDLESEDGLKGWTPLEWAVAFGHTEACRLLLQRGANPKETQDLTTLYYNFYRPEYSHWPLRLAARFGRLDIASLLIQFGAKVSSDEPELVAQDRGYPELAQLLCEWRGQGRCRYLVESKCRP